MRGFSIPRTAHHPMSLAGYARVSTTEGRQVLDRQLDALNASGAAADRPSLAACLDYLRRSDVLVVLDRFGIGFRAINSPMDTTTPAGRAFLQIQAAFAEMERNIIRQRMREGMKVARARGRKPGGAGCATAARASFCRRRRRSGRLLAGARCLSGTPGIAG